MYGVHIYLDTIIKYAWGLVSNRVSTTESFLAPKIFANEKPHPVELYSALIVENFQILSVRFLAQVVQIENIEFWQLFCFLNHPILFLWHLNLPISCFLATSGMLLSGDWCWILVIKILWCLKIFPFLRSMVYIEKIRDDTVSIDHEE